MVFFVICGHFGHQIVPLFCRSGDNEFRDACFLLGRQKVGLGVQLSNRCYILFNIENLLRYFTQKRNNIYIYI